MNTTADLKNEKQAVIAVIFTHLKLCLAAATHNFKWVKIVCLLCEKDKHLKGLAQAKIIKKSVILFRVLNMTI